MVIIVDDREPSDILDSIKASVTYERKRLAIGDYIVNNILIIERKTAPDFISSMLSGHLRSQVYRLTKVSSSPVLAVIGNIYIEAQGRINRKALIAFLASLSCKHNPEGAHGRVSFMFFETNYDFALYLKYIDEKTAESTIFINPVIYEVNDSDLIALRTAILASIPGIGEELAKRLLARFGNLRAIASATDEQLLNVRGISKKKAEIIHKVLSEGKRDTSSKSLSLWLEKSNEEK
ncbi:hypothetical protein DRO54_11085 [Candidatus Bathyarchaeota archaeon]|nr:MAG: hypothetical protein DRO54_11085 [Candidatus Bathyarchaeota archaeon]